MRVNINAIKVIGKKDFTDSLKSFGVYVVLGIIFLISFMSLYTLNEAGKDADTVNLLYGINIEKSAIVNVIFMFSVVLISFLYLGISSVTAIAKEKQEKTIELLFYSPLDEFSFVAGKFLGKISVYFLILLVSMIFFILVCFVFSIPINIDFIKTGILSIFLISCVIAGGLFLSTLSSNVSTSIFLLIGASIFLFVLDIIASFLNFLPFDPASLIGVIKNLVSGIISIINYISPFSYYNMGIEAIAKNDNVRLLLSMIYSIAYVTIFLMVSVIILMKKGVK